MTFFDSTADLVGQLNGNGQKGMPQIDAPPVENFWVRHCVTEVLEVANRKPKRRNVRLQFSLTLNHHATHLE